MPEPSLSLTIPTLFLTSRAASLQEAGPYLIKHLLLERHLRETERTCQDGDTSGMESMHSQHGRVKTMHNTTVNK